MAASDLRAETNQLLISRLRELEELQDQASEPARHREFRTEANRVRKLVKAATGRPASQA